MKNIQQILVVTVIFILGASIFGACVRDDFEHSREPDCEPEIQDEDYTGPTSMILGFGRGAITAANLKAKYPDQFALVAGIGGPISLMGLFNWCESNLSNFDNWADTVLREEKIAFFNALFMAIGNPLYRNLDSKYYPPGTDREDFEDPDNFEVKTINGFIDRLNPDGALPVITFKDESGVIVSFALALDKNENGLRDPGEPLIIQTREYFNDSNQNGIYDKGETFDDFGLDGVMGTDDYGEGNGQFDLSPIAAEYYENDLTQHILDLDYDPDRNYIGAIYSDMGTDNPWEFQETNEFLIDEVSLITDGQMDAHCITNSLGVYDKYLWGAPYPTETPFINERFLFVNTPGSDESDLVPWDEFTEPLRVRRILQALFFLSSRTPQWAIYKPEKDGTGVVYQEHSFVSDSGARVYLSVALPSGYHEKRSKWITYPVIYVIPDKGYEPGDWRELATLQGWLEQQNYAQKSIIVIVDPDSKALGEGYSFFSGPVDMSKDDINAGDLFVEITQHIESRYRVKDIK